MPTHIIDENSCHRDGRIYKDYDCTLNQTNIKTNANKFYIMQIIEKQNKYYVFIRYGRVGEKGVSRDESFSNVDGAISKFKKQFKSKTGNVWNVENFISKKGKYWLCEMDYDDIDGMMDDIETETCKVECNLDERVQKFLLLVSDIDTMNKTMISLDIDTKKLPLGKLSQKQIEKGYDILNKIKLSLKKKQTLAIKDEIIDLSSGYYTIIPYVCGRGRAPPIIDSDQMVDEYVATLDELSNITVAANLIKDSKSPDNSNEHPLDNIYKKLNTTIEPVEKGSDVWGMIKDYVKNTHASTHSNYKVELLDIFEIDRQGERNKYETKFGDVDHRMLLWHGTRLSNYCSIMQKGLLLRPDVIPGTYITGKMFGYGVYGANSFSKSFNYCGADDDNNVACLFLAEFALGKTSNRVQSDYYITKDKLQQLGCDSTWGQGRTTPSGYASLPNGVKIPNGKLTKSNVQGGSLLYDEFIVYDQDQVNLRYIVKVKGNF